MAAPGWSPFLRSVTVGASISQLSVLLAALDPNFPVSVQMLNIQMDNVATGNLYIGNAAVSPTNCGVHIVPSQGFFVPANVYGKILTTDIFMVADGAGKQINIMALGAGM